MKINPDFIWKDNHGREINYLRLAITDRCNLRCQYCMPEEGIAYEPKDSLLTYEEMIRMVQVLAGLGISKVRITGGEPLVRKDAVPFMKALKQVKGLHSLHLTTNGTLTFPYLEELQPYLSSINLSLDSLQREKFFQITRRDNFKEVWKSLEKIVALGIPLKVNMVVMAAWNMDEIIPMAKLAEKLPIVVRFIEEMPFNGQNNPDGRGYVNDQDIYEILMMHFPDMITLPGSVGQTAETYHVPGFVGNLGVIAAYTRTFCGSCNRIRVTPSGMVKTCLYDQGIFNIRDIIRSGATDEDIQTAFIEAVAHRHKNGWEAERNRFLTSPFSESMSTIGG